MSHQAPQPIAPDAPLTEEGCGALYVKLAGRVTNLRTILMEPEVIQRSEAEAWAEDAISVLQDFRTLLDKTLVHVRRRIPAEEVAHK